MANDFVPVNSFWFPEEANMARIYLENYGISCSLEGAELIRMAWLDANAIGGVKLLVQESDAQRARELLNNRPSIDEHELSRESLSAKHNDGTAGETDDETALETSESHIFENLQLLKPFVILLFLLTPAIALLTNAALILAVLLNIQVLP